MSPHLNNPEKFEHERLSEAVTEIRLLECVSGDSTFKLHHFPLNETPPYFALSYHWGDPEPQHDISVNSMQLSITRNLTKALTTMFSPRFSEELGPIWSETDRILLWVDAICIDQDNVQEKNIQVPLMSEIYKRAKGAIGYIGSPSANRDPSHPIRAMIRRAGVGKIEENSKVIDNDATEFLSSPFFRRAWITQEAVLSPQFMCVYGSDQDCVSLSLDYLGSLIQTIQTPGRGSPEQGLILNDLENVGPAIMQIYVRAQLRSSLNLSPEGINIVKLLSLTRPAKATDQRDKVYSLVGLMTPQDRQKIHIDYSEHNTVAEVYTAIAKILIDSPDCMRMLSHAGISRNFPQLPTWVPDWSTEPRYPLDYRHYRSCGDTNAAVTISEDGRQLHLRGLLFGRIKVVSPRMEYLNNVIVDGPDGRTITEKHHVLIGLEETIYQFCRFSEMEHGRLPGLGTESEIISKTLTADRGMGDRRATPEDQKFYDNFAAQYPRDGPETTDPDPLAYYPFMISAQHCNGGRRTCYTNSAHVGLVPDDAQQGDWIAIFPGAELPFVIRNVKENVFQLIGHAYVHWAMDGELLQDLDALMKREFADTPFTVDNFFKGIVLV